MPWIKRNLFILIFTVFLLSPVIHVQGQGADDVIFNSSFDQGNLINVQYQEGNGYRYYTAEVNYSTITFTDKHWWFYYSMESVTGKTITVSITNLLSEDIDDDRWPNIEPVYSYDNNNTWYRIPFSNFSCCDGNTFNITLAPEKDKVWIAPLPPYPTWKRDELIDRYNDSPYFNAEVIGQTPLGFDIIVFNITNPNYDNSAKTKIYVTAQIHSGETVGSWVAQGLINYLMNETDETAQRLRRDYIFRINPLFNVEGVYYGISRYTPFRSGAQRDLNRNWDDTPIDYDLDREINITFEDIQSFMPDAVLDPRATINNESIGASHLDAFFIPSYSINAVLTRFMNNLSIGRTGDKDYWPETGTRLESFPTSTTMTNQIRQRLGITLSTMLEHPFDSRENTSQHPTDHNPQNTTDWEDWGRRITLGIHDYFGNALPTHSTPIITPTLAFTEDNITCTNQSTSDLDNDPVTNIYNWLLNGTSITLLNMPFETNLSTIAPGAVKDYSGYDNDGTLNSGTAMPTWTFDGKLGGAFEYDGNDYFNISNSPSLNNSYNFTVTVWIKPSTISGAHYILGNSPDGGVSEGEIFFYQNGDDINAFVDSGTNFVSAANVLVADKWHHVALVMISGQNLSIYVNGSYVNANTGVTSGPFLDKENDYYVGSLSGLANYFNGTIDELRIYNHSLTPQQIQQLYLEGLNNLTNSTIVSQETLEDQNWTCEVTPNDATDDGETLSASRAIAFCPSPPAGSDWNISTFFACKNEEIYLAQDKDLNILNNGSLLFINTTFWINQTSDSSSAITVFSGGSMNITDNSGDGSLINSTNPDYEFIFRVDSGSNFSMTNSRVEESNSPGVGINTTVTEFSGNVFANSYIGVTLYSDNNVIVNNTFNSNDAYGLYISNSNNNTITGNNVYDNIEGITLIYDFSEFNNNTITNNNISYNDYGIHLSYSENNTISNNTINSNNLNGIYLVSNSNNNTITDNNVSYNSINGIYLSSSNNTITNNNISYNDDGIYVGSSNNILTNNTISHNNNTGIYSGGTNIILTNNNISFNNDTGIHLEDAVNITSTDNNISYNTNYGIHSYDSDSGVFIRNILGNNSINIYFHSYKISVSNIFIDSVLTNSVNYDINTSSQFTENIILLNTTFNKSKVYIESDVTIYVKWYLDVFVKDSHESTIENANVTAWDNSSNFAFSELTGSNGYIERQNLTEYSENTTGKYFLTSYTINTVAACCESDSRSLNITNSTILIIVLIPPPALFITLNINNTGNTVYIPVQGIGEIPSSQLGPGANYTNHTHNYLASYNSTSLTALAAQTATRLFVSNTTTYHTIKISQFARNSRIFLVFTKGNWQTIDNRMMLIESGQFLAKISPSFAFGLGIYYPIKMLLNYSDIDIEGNLILRKGTHKLTLDYNDTTNGKPAIIFSRG